MAMELTGADKIAVSREDGSYFCTKGADCYCEENYERAVEYYRLAAAMGDVQSLSNLGYCYMYGRGIPVNASLAVAYFQMAAQQGCVDAIYKLGDIYRQGFCGVEADQEVAAYYFHWAEDIVGHNAAQLELYPSLCKALAFEKMPDGYLHTDLEDAYFLLKLAKDGYEKEIANGALFYEDCLEEVIDMLNDPMFNEQRGISFDEKEAFNYTASDLMDLDDDDLPDGDFDPQTVEVDEGDGEDGETPF